MDEERPTSRMRQSPLRNEVESTGTIPVEPGLNPRLPNTFDNWNPAVRQIGLGLSLPDEVDPRTVPRWISPAQDTGSLHSIPPHHGSWSSPSSRSDEERPQPNYAIRPRHTHNNAPELGQTLFGEDSGSHHSTAESESTQSEAQWASRPTSTASLKSSRLGRGRELCPPGTANNGTACGSIVLETQAGAPEPHCHEEGLSYNHVSPLHGSYGHAGEEPVPGDPLSQQATQIEGQSRPTSTGSTRQSQSNDWNSDEPFELQNSDKSPYCNLGTAPSNVDEGFRTVRESPSDFGASGQKGTSEPNHFGADNDSKPEICNVMASPDSMESAPTPSSVPMLSSRDCDKSDSPDSKASKAQDQRSTGVNYSEPASVLASSPDARQRLLRCMPSTEGNGQDHSGLSKEDPGRWTPGNTDCSIETRPGNLKVSRDTALHFSKHERFRASQKILEPELTQADPQLLPSNPLHIDNGHDSKESSAPSSPLPTPGWDVTGFQDGLTSGSSTVSTDSSEHSESEDNLPKGGPSPGTVARDALTKESITCVLFGWLYGQIVLNLPSEVENTRKCPGEPGSGQADRSAAKNPVMEYPRPQDNNGSIRREWEDERGDEGDDQSRRPEQNIQKLDGSPTRPPRPLACPFHKYDPERYSAMNEAEKEYRICSSGYWPDISRLKQHLYRTHLRPESYCRRCYVVFEEELDFESHCRRPIPCVCQSERQFQEKISDQQLILIKKKRPGASPRNSWNTIFKILFPHANIPESPYFETPEHEMRRSLPEHFGREIRPILSSLLQQNLHPPLTVNPEVLDQICETATTLALQRVALGSEITSRQSHSNTISNRQLQEAYPANPHIQELFGTHMVQSQVEMINDNSFHMQLGPPTRGYPLFPQPGGSMGPNSYNSMSPTSPNIPLGYQRPRPEQPVVGVPGAAFDRAFAEFDGPSNQNTFLSWSHLY